MHIQRRLTRICDGAAIVLILTIATPVAGYSQPPAPPRDIAAFFHEIIGEWIGTVEQSTDGIKADTKYFHAVAKQTRPDAYESVFEYFRLDSETHSLVQVGVTSMATKTTPEGNATNTVTGTGDVFLNPETSRPEEHQLSEVLRMSPSGSLEGRGSGTISVGGVALGAGKNGKVSEYTSTWALNDGVLSIRETLRVTFRILFFAIHYDIVDDFTAERGSDIMGLMKGGSSRGKDVTRSTPTPSPPIRR